MKVDVYRCVVDLSLRMLVERDAGLPRHVDPDKWMLISPYEHSLEEKVLCRDEGVALDIGEVGFHFCKLVPLS